jgi:hypothetical protein
LWNANLRDEETRVRLVGLAEIAEPAGASGLEPAKDVGGWF